MAGFADRDLAFCLMRKAAPPSVPFSIPCGPCREEIVVPRVLSLFAQQFAEETMERMKLKNVTAGVTVLALTLVWGSVSNAQEQTREQSRETTTPASEQSRQKADGERHGLPIETYAVAPATKFLVRLG